MLSELIIVELNTAISRLLYYFWLLTKNKEEMAKRLQSIFGTEEDKVNCPFYFKIGACRHGDTCTRVHNKPPVSQTMCFKHIY